jgi:hypothetical protein
VINACKLHLVGDDAGVFTLERNPDNLVRLLVKGTIDREVVDSYLLTIKCFKPAEKPSELRKMYNPQVLPILFDLLCHFIKTLIF